ncbi:hypothetical protein BTM25_22150 [Actinomadura rubteroloni]|uniref:DUF397 domain-containing protein n=1 Tax=Actinomadura rubteroloni TaxID=1926885 RepID=A0A2P4US03_9ACTN|nr:DUF397 domain-containing protein [Actinomadura rubteroloni]POM27794.1 hypothetical protein BTM25_22150 [Actinomadura rubteroloni]
MIRSNASTITGADVPNVRWQKSSFSGRNGDCVEAATLGAVHLARDSKDPDGPVLAFSRDTWAGFVGAAKAGDFDFG